MHGKDDGTTWGGILTAIAIVLAFFAGYVLRDSGYQVRLEPNHPVEVRR